MNEEPKIDSSMRLQHVLNGITFTGPLDFNWRFVFQPFEAAGRVGWLIWAEFARVDVDTDEPGIGRGREQVLWRGATVSAAVKTCWVIFEQIIRHEMMHAFRYQGRALFDPHATVAALHSISEQDKVPDSYALRTAEETR